MKKNKKKISFSATLSGENKVIDKSTPPKGLKDIIKKLNKKEALESKSNKQNETQELDNGK